MATFVILVAFHNMPSALQMLYGCISYMLWLAQCAVCVCAEDSKLHLAARTMHKTAFAQGEQQNAHTL